MIVGETCFWVYWASRDNISGIVASYHYNSSVGYAKILTTIFIECDAQGEV